MSGILQLLRLVTKQFSRNAGFSEVLLAKIRQTALRKAFFRRLAGNLTPPLLRMSAQNRFLRDNFGWGPHASRLQNHSALVGCICKRNAVSDLGDTGPIHCGGRVSRQDRTHGRAINRLHGQLPCQRLCQSRKGPDQRQTAVALQRLYGNRAGVKAFTQHSV